MRRSSAAAAEQLVHAGAHACTDVTGFGLAGHLAEMIRATGHGDEVSVDLSLDSLPVLSGAADLFTTGFASSLQPENLRARHLIDGLDGAVGHPHLPLLFDPQTAGGLLAAVPAEVAAILDGVIIGEIRQRDPQRAAINLV